MNEDYVSFEVAKLLKEKEFDWGCRAYYAPNSEVLTHSLDVSNTCNVDVYAAPPLHMAQKWFREAKGIHIVIDFKSKDSWYYIIYDLGENEFIEQSEEYFNTYEGALQAGILETLKII